MPLQDDFESGTFETGIIVKLEQIAKLDHLGHIHVARAVLQRYTGLYEEIAPGNPAHLQHALVVAEMALSNPTVMGDTAFLRQLDGARLELEDDMSAAEEDEETLVAWVLGAALSLVDVIAAKDEAASLKACKAATFTPASVGAEVDAILVDAGATGPCAAKEENAFADRLLEALVAQQQLASNMSGRGVARHGALRDTDKISAQLTGGQSKIPAPSWVERLVTIAFRR